MLKKPCSDSSDDLKSSEVINPSAPHLHGEYTPEAAAKCAMHGFAMIVFFLRDFLKVRHAVTGTLEQKDGLQLTASLIPSQKIREVQKE